MFEENYQIRNYDQDNAECASPLKKRKSKKTQKSLLFADTQPQNTPEIQISSVPKDNNTYNKLQENNNKDQQEDIQIYTISQNVSKSTNDTLDNTNFDNKFSKNKGFQLQLNNKNSPSKIKKPSINLKYSSDEEEDNKKNSYSNKKSCKRVMFDNSSINILPSFNNINQIDNDQNLIDNKLDIEIDNTLSDIQLEQKIIEWLEINNIKWIVPNQKDDYFQRKKSSVFIEYNDSNLSDQDDQDRDNDFSNDDNDFSHLNLMQKNSSVNDKNLTVDFKYIESKKMKSELNLQEKRGRKKRMTITTCQNLNAPNQNQYQNNQNLDNKNYLKTPLQSNNNLSSQSQLSSENLSFLPVKNNNQLNVAKDNTKPIQVIEQNIIDYLENKNIKWITPNLKDDYFQRKKSAIFDDNQSNNSEDGDSDHDKQYDDFSLSKKSSPPQDSLMLIDSQQDLVLQKFKSEINLQEKRRRQKRVTITTCQQLYD